jgi:hypothetical protein
MHTALAALLKHRPKPMSCEQISEALTKAGHPCSRQAVENWLSGRRGLSLFWFAQMAAVFDVPPDEVAEGRAAIIADLEAPPSAAAV